MNNWQQMLKRTWEGDPHSLLEELENGVITVEISVENPQNLKIVAQHDLYMPFLSTWNSIPL